MALPRFEWRRPHTGKYTQNGFTALILAAASGHVDCVRLLIDAGADKDAMDDVRRRSLYLCFARV